MKKFFGPALALVGLFVIGFSFLVAAPKPIASFPEQQGEVTVSGTGTVAVVPTCAHITTEVVTTDNMAGTALKLNNELVTKVMESLNKFNIDKKDIKTTNFNVRPYFKRDDNGRTTAKGYQVSNGVAVTVRNLDNFGKILDGLLENIPPHSVEVANIQVSNISFEATNVHEFEKEVLKIAMKNAKEKATVLAEADNAKLGEVLTISDISVSGLYHRYERGESADLAPGRAIPLSAGTKHITANITVKYCLTR